MGGAHSPLPDLLREFRENERMSDIPSEVNNRSLPQLT